MKYVECAYAGSVPLGEPSLSLGEVARGTVSRYSGSIFDLLADVRAPLDELEERARLYRSRMKALRDPRTVRSSFEDQAARALGWT